MNFPDGLDHAAIARILPHRWPFLYVDRITAFEPERRIVGVKLVTRDEPSLAPNGDARVLPVAVMLEAVAQVGAVLLLASPARTDMIVLMLGIKRARIRRPASVGEEIVFEARLDRIKGAMGRMYGEARVDGERIAYGTISFALAPKSALDALN